MNIRVERTCISGTRAQTQAESRSLCARSARLCQLPSNQKSRAKLRDKRAKGRQRRKVTSTSWCKGIAQWRRTRNAQTTQIVRKLVVVVCSGLAQVTRIRAVPALRIVHRQEVPAQVLATAQGTQRWPARRMISAQHGGALACSEDIAAMIHPCRAWQILTVVIAGVLAGPRTQFGGKQTKTSPRTLMMAHGKSGPKCSFIRSCWC